MTKTLTEIKKEFDALILSNNKKIKEVTEQLELKKTDLNTLEVERERAEGDIDISKFEEANKKVWTAEQTIKMLERMLNNLKTAPIITKERLIEYEDEINRSASIQRTEAKKMFDAIKEKLGKAILKDLNARVEGQNLLDELVSKVLRNNQDYFRDENGSYRGSNLSLKGSKDTLDYEVQEFIRSTLKQ